jgi:transposase-like protein
VPEPHDCLINGKPATVDEAAKFMVEQVAAGYQVTIGWPPCPRCGATERYRNNPIPSWMNRFTCPKCGRNESR